jgi:hypothetical protein
MIGLRSRTNKTKSKAIGLSRALIIILNEFNIFRIKSVITISKFFIFLKVLAFGSQIAIILKPALKQLTLNFLSTI